MMCDLVSIIVPVYNAEKTIWSCVDSVLMQTEKNIELLLIDDGSTDRSGQLCDEYVKLDPRVRAIHQSNQGVSAARNVGMKCARGGYITFLDADDTLFPNAISALKTQAQSCDADMTIGELYHCGTDGANRAEGVEKILGPLKGEDLIRLALEDHPYTYYAFRILYKTSFLMDMRFVPGRICGEDSFFIFECAIKHPSVEIVHEPVYSYMFNSSSATHTLFSDKRYDDILYFLERKIAYIEAEYPCYNEKLYNLIVKIHMMLLQNMCLLTGEKWKERRKFSFAQFKKYKRYFIPATESNKKWFFILSHGLYNVYSVALWLKKHI